MRYIFGGENYYIAKGDNQDMCPSGMTCLSADCCFSELAL